MPRVGTGVSPVQPERSSVESGNYAIFLLSRAFSDSSQPGFHNLQSIMPPAVAPGEIERAAQLLRAGRLVAFPTETVYGLGANALDTEAVARIYAVKRRPHTSPLIVHVASIEMAQSLVVNWPEAAERLARQFWPGPLTLVLAKAHGAADAFLRLRSGSRPSESSSTASSWKIPDIVTANLPTVGLRMPAHPIASQLIRAAGVPLAAPSANRFTELSPTTAEHVRRSLGSDVDFILDGGPCQVGIESTVLSLADSELNEPELNKPRLNQQRPVLLRPGGISRSELEAIVGPLASMPEIQTGAHPSPGLHPRHYSPRTPMYLVTNGKLPDHGQSQQKRQGIYLQHQHAPSRADIVIHQMPHSAADYAAALYDMLHQADTGNYSWIAVDTPPRTPEWEAVHDRLRRAATP
ncbi:MAG: L-threonylcarbamoyladenylate synthase [Terriglobales bacterium]